MASVCLHVALPIGEFLKPPCEEGVRNRNGPLAVGLVVVPELLHNCFTLWIVCPIVANSFSGVSQPFFQFDDQRCTSGIVVNVPGFVRIIDQIIQLPARWCLIPTIVVASVIVDQFVSSCGCDGKLLLIDCRSLDFREVSLGGGGRGEESNNNVPVLVIANSNVKHSLGDSQYPIRVQQCKDATAILSKCNPQIKSLRDAKMEDIETAKSSAGLEGVLLQRARHVVSENNRAIATAEALENSKWEEVGKLMNESHSSMKDDYETSCGEIDILQDLARRFSGVFGSRLTGGGFGGCTVTLVAKDRAQGLIEYLKEEYKKETGKQCDCFVTSPGSGARVILL